MRANRTYRYRHSPKPHRGAVGHPVSFLNSLRQKVDLGLKSLVDCTPHNSNSFFIGKNGAGDRYEIGKGHSIIGGDMGRIVASLLTAVILTAASSAFAQPSGVGNDSIQTLTVQGKVRVFAPADRAVVTFEVLGEGKSLAAAFDQARQRVDSLSLRLKAIGVAEDALATSLFSSNENYGHKAFLSSKRDYRATMTASVTTDSLELLEGIVVALSESNIERIDAISFELVKYEAIRREALAKAVRKAKDKAEVMCAELETRLGRVLRVDELPAIASEPQPFSSNRYKSVFNSTLQVVAGVDLVTEDQTTSVFAKEMQFDALVQIVFALDSLD